MSEENIFKRKINCPKCNKLLKSKEFYNNDYGESYIFVCWKCQILIELNEFYGEEERPTIKIIGEINRD